MKIPRRRHVQVYPGHCLSKNEYVCFGPIGWLVGRVFDLIPGCAHFWLQTDLVCVYITRFWLLPIFVFECTAALNSIRDGPMGHGLGCGDESCIDWRQRHNFRVFSALCPLSGCLAYGAFVAAVAHFLAWAVSRSFFFFSFLIQKWWDQKRKTKTSTAARLGLILAIWPMRESVFLRRTTYVSHLVFCF